MEKVGFLDYFDGIEDPRHESYKKYPVDELLFVSLCGVICGAEGWKDIEAFGKAKVKFLKEYLSFKNGIASDDTFRRFFRAIDSEKFQACFISWVNSFSLELGGKVIAINGKTSRRSFDGEKKALHMLSAFATEARHC